LVASNESDLVNIEISGASERDGVLVRREIIAAIGRSIALLKSPTADSRSPNL